MAIAPANESTMGLTITPPAGFVNNQFPSTTLPAAQLTAWQALTFADLDYLGDIPNLSPTATVINKDTVPSGQIKMKGQDQRAELNLTTIDDTEEEAQILARSVREKGHANYNKPLYAYQQFSNGRFFYAQVEVLSVTTTGTSEQPVESVIGIVVTSDVTSGVIADFTPGG